MRPQTYLIRLYITITLVASFHGHFYYANAQSLLKNTPQQQNVCNYDIIPSAPRNLVLIPRDGAVEAKWWSPSNRPCEVTYEVRAFEEGGIVKMAAFEVKETKTMLYGLRDDKKYEITVTARTQRGRSAPIQATTSPIGGSTSSLISGNFNLVPANLADWKCTGDVAVAICPAAASRLCNAMSCAEIAKRGLCQASFMRSTNWQKKEVTQYCSGECGCLAQPSLRTRMAGPAADACCAIQTGEYFRDENGRSTNGIDTTRTAR